METQITQHEDLELKNLSAFYGTMEYHNVMGTQTTDGIIYLMENGYSWFVTDFLSFVAVNPKSIRNQEFLTIKLLHNPYANNATMEISDGNGNVLDTQIYQWTDAKKDLTLFYTNGVLMLSGEY